MACLTASTLMALLSSSMALASAAFFGATILATLSYLKTACTHLQRPPAATEPRAMTSSAKSGREM